MPLIPAIIKLNKNWYNVYLYKTIKNSNQYIPIAYQPHVYVLNGQAQSYLIPGSLLKNDSRIEELRQTAMSTTNHIAKNFRIAAGKITR